jgi:multiple sugar transport system substrate-binding protein
MMVDASIDPWARDDRLVDLSDAVGPLEDLFDPDVLAASRMVNGRTGQHGLYGLPVARSTYHIHVWTNLLEQAGFTLADIPKEWDAFWSFWCDRVQPAVRQATGREDIWAVGLAMSIDSPGEIWLALTQFKYAYDTYWGVSAEGRNRVADPTMRDTNLRHEPASSKPWTVIRPSIGRAARRQTRRAGATAAITITTRRSSRSGSS